MRAITEKLNYLDHQGIDNGNYFDLLNLYESVEQKLSAQDKLELKKLLNTTDDPKTISAYLDSVNEDYIDADEMGDDWEGDYDDSQYEYDDTYKELTDDVLNYIADNGLYVDDIFPTKSGFIITIGGDWKHEHLRLNTILKRYFNENNITAKIDTIPLTNDGSDNYIGNHIVTILAINESLQSNTTLKENLNEEIIETGLDKLKQLEECISQLKSLTIDAIEILESENRHDTALTLQTDVLLQVEETVEPYVIDEINEYNRSGEYDE